MMMMVMSTELEGRGEGNEEKTFFLEQQQQMKDDDGDMMIAAAVGDDDKPLELFRANSTNINLI